MEEQDQITALARHIYTTNELNGWHETWNLMEKMMMVVTELAEAVEEIRDHSSTEVYFNPEEPEKPEGFPVEIADTIIRLLDIADHEGFAFKLSTLIEQKNEYNATRGHRHGGRKY
jgi:hypothetical protein